MPARTFVARGRVVVLIGWVLNGSKINSVASSCPACGPQNFMIARINHEEREPSAADDVVIAAPVHRACGEIPLFEATFHTLIGGHDPRKSGSVGHFGGLASRPLPCPNGRPPTRVEVKRRKGNDDELCRRRYMTAAGSGEEVIRVRAEVSLSRVNFLFAVLRGS